MNDVAMKVRELPQTGAISPAKFAHFVLRTGQFDQMIEWYQTVLAARIVFRDERLCFLSYDDEHHRQGSTGRPYCIVAAPAPATRQRRAPNAH